MQSINPSSDTPKSPAITPTPDGLPAKGEAPYNPLADSSTIALPKLSVESQVTQAATTSDLAFSEASQTRAASAEARLNAKVICGEVATVAAMGAILQSALPTLLENAPVEVLKFLCGYKGTELIFSLIRESSIIEQISTKEVRPEDTAKVERVQGILQPLCAAFGVAEPSIRLEQNEQLPAVLLNAPWMKPTLVISPDILEKLTDRELKAVLAHEITHLNPGYVRFQIVTRAMAWVAKPSLLVGAGALAFNTLSPQYGPWMAFPLACGTAALQFGLTMIGAELASLWTNRKNELKSDIKAVRLTGDPEALISALQKIEPPEAQREEFRCLQEFGAASHPSIEERTNLIRKVFNAPASEETGSITTPSAR